MELKIFSQDSYFSLAVNSLFQSVGSHARPQSIVLLDVMNLPELRINDVKLANDSDYLIFVVNGLNDYLLIENGTPLELKKNTNVKYICKSSSCNEFKEIIKGNVRSSQLMGDGKSSLTKTELKLIDSMRYGTPIRSNPLYKDTNQKTLSARKRTVMRKLNVATEIKFYKVVMKCFHLKMSISGILS